MKKVLVAGATGYLGQYVVRAYKQQGYWVRALARSAEKLGALADMVDDAFIGDVTDPGFAWFHNTDSSNYVEVGSYDVNTNFLAFLKLRAGEKAAVWLRPYHPPAEIPGWAAAHSRARAAIRIRSC